MQKVTDLYCTKRCKHLVKMINFKCLLVITFITILILLYKFKEISSYDLNLSVKNILEDGKPKKVILYWNDYFSIKDYFGKGVQPFENCGSCYITSDRNYMPIDEYDAIIFHAGDEDLYIYNKPEKRNEKQRYVYYMMETPLNKLTIGNYSQDFFNWTLTYWKKSDITIPYGNYVAKDTNYILPNEGFFKNKTKMAAWFASNCKSNNKREEYVKELQKYVEVDVYGLCGQYNCSKNERDNCYKMIENDYFFYLSFENTFCEDYVTEKLYFILGYNVIPVVYGYGNYTESAPPRSVINVADFKTPKELAKYMTYLKDNPNEYLSYFQWKKDFAIYDSCGHDAVCSLCKKLHSDNTTKTYDNLTEWWTGNCIDHTKIVINKEE